MLTLTCVISVIPLLFGVYVAVGGAINPLFTFLNILRKEKADGCELISQGILITFQDSNSTGTSALIARIELVTCTSLTAPRQV